MKKFLLAGLLAVTVMVLFALPAAAKVGGSNGRIVFSRYDTATDDNFTYTANPDGSNPQPLFPSFNSGSPHWSPNGSEVAVNSGLDFPCCSGHTVIINPDTGAFRVVIPEGPPVVFPFCTIWSPDSNRFACEAFNDDDPSVNGVYTIRSSDGGDLKRVTNGPDTPIDYSPDGKQIVFGRDAHNCVTKSALYVVNVDGTGLHRITPYGFCDDVGGWSPDGKWIVFARSIVQRDGFQFHFGPTGKLFVVHPDGSGLTQVVLQGGVGAFDASWSPDGKKIIFGYFSDTAVGIATANSDGSDVQEVTTSPTFDHQADWGTHPIVAG
jgi:Tol biopolymer transport system component